MAHQEDTQQRGLIASLPKKQAFADDNEDDLTRANHELSCYESTINCCGSFFGTLRAWCPCICFMFPYPYFQINQGSKGLLQKFGKYQKTLDPGFHLINPCSDRIISVSTKTFVLDLNRQIILTKDNITLQIDTILYYRLFDIIKATYRVKEIVLAVKEITYATLRSVCGEHTLQDILEHRSIISSEIENHVFDTVASWGVYVEQIFIKDMILSEDLQSSLSMAPKSVKFAQSKIISAKADVETAKLLREASDLLDSKAAMQIRYFETIQGIAKAGNPKILFVGLSAGDVKK